MRHLLSFAVCIVFVFGSITPSRAQPIQSDDGYTLEEVLAAYEAGQFRTIYTKGQSISTSQNGTYIYAATDGIYRVSDGRYLRGFDYYISPDERYGVINYDGIYRLSDEAEIVDTTYVSVSKIKFSDDSQYASIERYGVYRLSDGQWIIDTLSREIHFSSDSQWVSTDEGIYRLSDGQLVIEMDGPALFSLDGTYAVGDAVFRLSDGQWLFAISGSPYDVTFTPDMNYAVIVNDGIYRLSDGQKIYTFSEIIDPYMVEPAYSLNSDYVAIREMGVYHIPDGEKLFDLDKYEDVVFSQDSSLVAIGYRGIYRLSDKTQLFEINSSVYWGSFSPDGQYFAAEDYVYHVPDGQRLINLGGRPANISPTGEYAVVNNNGLYRLSDQQKLFDIDGYFDNFSPDGAYLQLGLSDFDASIYRVSDGYHYRGLQILDVSKGIMAIGNTVLVVDPTQQGRRLPVVYLTDEVQLYDGPHDSYRSASLNDGQYIVVSATQHGWYLVNLGWGQIGWLNPADDIEFLYAPG